MSWQDVEAQQKERYLAREAWSFILSNTEHIGDCYI